MKLLENLKVLGIRVRTRRCIVGPQHTPRSIVSFPEASRIGLLYEDNETGRLLASNFCDQMRQQGKFTAMLGHRTSERTSANPISECVTLNSFDVWGRLRSTCAVEFLETCFDYLYHLDFASTALSDYALGLCRAKCRVGFYQNHRQHFYDVMVHLRQATNESAIQVTQDTLHQLLKYTAAL